MGCVYNIIICIAYTYSSKHKYNKKTCIKIVLTDYFAYEARQGTQQLKKAISLTLKEIK